jgi:glycosyltransferase involved in cell wall biosynthesis
MIAPSQCSVVIPTYNRSALLKRVLEALGRQTKLECLREVLVISDGSTDDTAKIVADFTKVFPVRFIQREKSGVSAVRNAGLREATGSIILFLDDDIVPGEALVEEHVRFHDDHPEPEAALQGYVRWHRDMYATPFMEWYGESGALFAFSRMRDGEQIDPRFLYTCNLSAKVEFLNIVGGFNEQLTVMEDLEFGHRFAAADGELYFRKLAIGYHYQRFTFAQSCDRLKRYSVGLPAFIATDAGAALLKTRNSPLFRTATWGVRMAGPLMRPFRNVLDSGIKLPGPIYRLFYWYFASQKSFWDLASEKPGK